MSVAHLFFSRFSTLLRYTLLFGIGLSWSCNTTINKDEATLSVSAKKVLKHADTLTYYGHGKQALHYIDSAYRTFRPSIKDLFEKHNVKAIYYLQIDVDKTRANHYADSMLFLLKGKENQFKLEYTTALFVKGDAVSAEREYNKAFKYYYDAREFAKKNLDSCKVYGFSHRLGLIRYKQERYLEAIPYIKHSLSGNNYCNDKADIESEFMNKQNRLNALALCFERAGILDSALYYYHQTLTFINQIGPKLPAKKDFIQTAKGVVFGNMGGVYLQKGNYNEAEKYLKQSITINDRPHFALVDAQTAKLKLANLYLQRSNFSKAYILLTELQFALDHPIPEREMMTESRLKLYQLQWQYFDRIQVLPKAYQKMKLYHHLLDSITRANQSLRGADMNLAFKANDQQYKLTLLDKENEIKRSYLIAIVVFASMVIIVLIGVWKSRQKLKIMNAKIKQQNSDMQKVLKALEQSQEENTRMMKIVAHDLRSPIAAAISIATALKGSHLSLEDHELLQQLETLSQHSLEMIEELLGFNEEHKGLVIEPIELHILLRHCVNLLKFRADGKNQQLRLSVIEAVVKVDAEKIWRVISNLIINAIKFSPHATIIEIKMLETKEAIVVKVKDQGIGIPQQMQEKIFDIFTDVKRLGTDGELSFGMGLAISKQLIEAHGGKIELESEVGVGSTFLISIPKGK